MKYELFFILFSAIFLVSSVMNYKRDKKMFRVSLVGFLVNTTAILIGWLKI